MTSAFIFPPSAFQIQAVNCRQPPSTLARHPTQWLQIMPLVTSCALAVFRGIVCASVLSLASAAQHNLGSASIKPLPIGHGVLPTKLGEHRPTLPIAVTARPAASDIAIVFTAFGDTAASSATRMLSTSHCLQKMGGCWLRSWTQTPVRISLSQLSRRWHSIHNST